MTPSDERQAAAAEFDSLLEHELQRRFGSVSGPVPWPSRAAYKLAARSRRGARRPRSVGLVVAVAAGLLALGSVIAATAATGTTDPTVWGQQVKTAVENCKDQLSSGQHGIGDCVSDFAQQHGKSHKNSNLHNDASQDQHTGSGSNSGGPASPNGNANNGNAKGKPSGVPNGPPASPGSGGNGNGPRATPPGHTNH
jgi:hypothetical protein